MAKAPHSAQKQPIARGKVSAHVIPNGAGTYVQDLTVILEVRDPFKAVLAYKASHAKAYSA
jgi:hypothetical protein